MDGQIGTIVLVADIFEHDSDNVTFNARTLEKPSIDYTEDLLRVLNKYCKHTQLCTSPKDLNEYLLNNNVDLVMTIYGGEVSRNRMALVPAICESMNVKYMGADTYNRIICQDKNLCKTFAKKFNILSPTSILINNKNDLFLLPSLKFPIVIKPNYEGSSIGISNKNIIHNLKDAKELINEMLIIFNQPLLAEEFIGGKEVNITLVGDNSSIDIFEVIEDINLEDEYFFDSNLYTLEYKQLQYDKFGHKVITASFDAETKQNIINMYKSMGKTDYIRVDGKIFENKFYLIELTPDPYCAKDSSFAKGIMRNGYSYEQAIGLLIQNSLKYYQTQCSSEQARKL